MRPLSSKYTCIVIFDTSFETGARNIQCNVLLRITVICQLRQTLEIYNVMYYCVSWLICQLRQTLEIYNVMCYSRH